MNINITKSINSSFYKNLESSIRRLRSLKENDAAYKKELKNYKYENLKAESEYLIKSKKLIKTDEQKHIFAPHDQKNYQLPSETKTHD